MGATRARRPLNGAEGSEPELQGPLATSLLDDAAASESPSSSPTPSLRPDAGLSDGQSTQEPDKMLQWGPGIMVHGAELLGAAPEACGARQTQDTRERVLQQAEYVGARVAAPAQVQAALDEFFGSLFEARGRRARTRMTIPFVMPHDAPATQPSVSPESSRGSASIATSGPGIPAVQLRQRRKGTRVPFDTLVSGGGSELGSSAHSRRRPRIKRGPVHIPGVTLNDLLVQPKIQLSRAALSGLGARTQGSHCNDRPTGRSPPRPPAQVSASVIAGVSRQRALIQARLERQGIPLAGGIPDDPAMVPAGMIHSVDVALHGEDTVEAESVSLYEQGWDAVSLAAAHSTVAANHPRHALLLAGRTSALSTRPILQPDGQSATRTRLAHTLGRIPGIQLSAATRRVREGDGSGRIGGATGRGGRVSGAWSDAERTLLSFHHPVGPLGAPEEDSGPDALPRKYGLEGQLPFAGKTLQSDWEWFCQPSVQTLFHCPPQDVAALSKPDRLARKRSLKIHRRLVRRRKAASRKAASRKAAGGRTR